MGPETGRIKQEIGQRLKAGAAEMVKNRLAPASAQKPAAPMGEPLFRSSLAYDSTATSTLVILCSSSRFLAQSQEFLRAHLNMGDYDLLAVPGGVQSLALPDILPKHHKVLGWMTKFLVDSHDLKRIILLAHEDCGTYKDGGALGAIAHIATGKSIADCQMDQLRKVRQSLAETFHVNVEAYYAMVNAGTVEFGKVE